MKRVAKGISNPEAFWTDLAHDSTSGGLAIGLERRGLRRFRVGLFVTRVASAFRDQLAGIAVRPGPGVGFPGFGRLRQVGG